ncbi:MAG: class I SAM-dependent DNA methyltransferase [Leptospira sp.]|nr:class I SAM-dependent DNA methyltransferase [Leptospira sp.]
MNISEIESNVQKIMKSPNKGTWIYDFLLSYGLPKSSVARLQKGNQNLSKTDGEISWKKKLLFREVKKKDLHLEISELEESYKHDERFLIATDYKTFLAVDTKTKERLDIEFKDLIKHFDFFLPWAGMEKSQYASENPADVKAAVKMAKLFDEIKKDNPDTSPEFLHGLNVFMARLLFCYFAEDTNIFGKDQFTNAIASHTQEDGSDLDSYLEKLFEVLNTPPNKRKKLPNYLTEFPYVNGGLFDRYYPVPKLSRKSRSAMVENGELNWSAINPDIFGSMFQASIGEEQRDNLGQHYTSVPNIMKVIEPLFLNELYEEFEKAKGKKKKLLELLDRISKIKIFDPACGSGNFLIIAYKELRKLEMLILKETKMMQYSSITLSQFYGIEIDDFAHEIAQLSLWLAEHQMNTEFFQELGVSNPTLPLKKAGNIALGNACRIDWETVCSHKPDEEVYILGNPPYVGSSNQSKEQKEDVSIALESIDGYKNLDYIAIWFYKGSEYLKSRESQMAFVSTNSICQGQQVQVLWSYLLKKIEIGFAFTSFKWTNNAKNNAGVTVCIVGLRIPNENPKIIYQDNSKLLTKNINPYLISYRNIIVDKRSKPLSNIPIMLYGNKPADGGFLTLEANEKNKFELSDSRVKRLIKRFIGSDELLYNKDRFCLWIDDDQLELANSIPEIKNRIDKVKKFRSESVKVATIEKARTPHRFSEARYTNKDSIIVPSVTSENRNYIPMGFLNSEYVISNLAFAIYDPEPYIFGVISSRMHVIWIKSVCGSLETRIRYSSTLGYNTFPFPDISDTRKQEITQCVFRILEEREKHPEKTLAELYDPDKMPPGLKEAHEANDTVIERCYRSKPFATDEERLEYLFSEYERMIELEKNRGGLFEVQAPAKKKGRKK